MKTPSMKPKPAKMKIMPVSMKTNLMTVTPAAAVTNEVKDPAKYQ